MFSGLKRLLSIPGRLLALEDRGAGIDNKREFWGQKIALRNWQTDFDLVANTNNANVYICIRAISDAIRMLPLDVMATETIGGVIREIDDNDHPANDLIRKPNPKYSLKMLTTHIVKSLLGDGNSYITIEKVPISEESPTGLELYPRDPRNMKYKLVDGEPVGFMQGAMVSFPTTDTVSYKLEEVIHIRDVDPANNLYGASRIEAVRDEVALDNYVNAFNSAFFLNGGVLNYVLNPKEPLSDAQHEQIVAALGAQINQENSFSIFVNKYPGSLDTPDQKHKDIAFIEQLKHNREKIFGQYGLPPFRGGVMEYANYANALAQDLDFWNNTIKPICAIIEDALDRQLMWLYFDDEHGFRFNYSDVPALQGDPKTQAEIHQIYYNSKVMTPNEIREDLDMEPIDEGDETAEEPKQTKEDEEEMAHAIYKLFQRQKKSVLSKISKFCINGRMMSRFRDAKTESMEFFSIIEANKETRQSISPIIKQFLYEVCNNGDVDKVLDSINFDRINEYSIELIRAHLSDTNKYNYNHRTLIKKIRTIFTHDRAAKETRRQMEDILYSVNKSRNMTLEEILGGQK